MIRIALFLTFLVTSVWANAQQFQGRAEYFSKRIDYRKTPELLELGEEGSEKKENLIGGKEMQEAIQATFKKSSEKKFSLLFNKSESLYEQIKEMNNSQAQSNGSFMVTVSISEDEGKTYLNLNEKKKYTEQTSFDKEFLVVEPIEKPDWKMLGETKKIGEYTCYKAELTIPVSDMERKRYEDFLEREKASPALFKMTEPKDRIVTAWYTPDIPVSFGPGGYWGLPGLILELSNENNVILCSKIALNGKEKFTIKAPKNGKKVSRQEFEKWTKDFEDKNRTEDGVIMIIEQN